MLIVFNCSSVISEDDLVIGYLVIIMSPLSTCRKQNFSPSSSHTYSYPSLYLDFFIERKLLDNVIKERKKKIKHPLKEDRTYHFKPELQIQDVKIRPIQKFIYR